MGTFPELPMKHEDYARAYMECKVRNIELEIPER